MGFLYPWLLMMLLVSVQSTVLVKLEFWNHVGEIYPNVSGTDPNGDHNGINGTSEDDTDRNIYPAPGKGIYNDGSTLRYIKVKGQLLGSTFTISTWVKLEDEKQTIIGNVDPVNEEVNANMRTNTGGRIKFRLGDLDYNNTGWISTVLFQANQWEYHTMTFSQNDALLKYFIGTQEAHSHTYIGTWAQQAGDQIRIAGGAAGAGSTMYGYVYDFHILDTYEAVISTFQTSQPTVSCGIEQNPDCSGTWTGCNTFEYWVNDVTDCNACDRCDKEGWTYDFTANQQSWVNCHTNCATCYGQNAQECLTCPSGRFRQPTPNEDFCETTCPQGLYGETLDNTCKPCAPSWVDWDGSASACTSCQDTNASVISGTWTCNSGWYDSDSTDGVTCDQWNTTWDTCTAASASSCVSCPANYFLYPPAASSATCLSSCPTGWYAETRGGTWQQWDSACDGCTASGYTSCISCATPYVKQPPVESSTECLSSCPTGWYTEPNVTSCQQWDTAWDACTAGGDNSCISCATNYFKQPPVESSTQCLTSCPTGWYGDSSGVCMQCHGTCATWAGAGDGQCIECSEGLSRADSDTAPSKWDCSNAQNTTKATQLACIDQSTQSNATTADVIQDLSAIVQNEELTADDFEIIVGTVDSSDPTTASEETEAIDVVITGGKNVMLNTDLKSLQVTTDKIEAQFNVEEPQNLQGSQIVTKSGSGVLVPNDLVASTGLSPDAPLLVNVVQLKTNSTTSLSEYDVISVSIDKLLTDGQTASVHLENLSTNFTIVMDGQNFNISETFEWVYLNVTEWITDGCFLTSLDSDRSEWAWNHLTEFSMRKVAEGAKTDSNIAATVEFENAADFSFDKNKAPVILIGVVLAVFFPVYFILRRNDKKQFPDEFQSTAINALQNAFINLWKKRNSNIKSEVTSPQSSSFQGSGNQTDINNSVCEINVTRITQRIGPENLFWKVKQEEYKNKDATHQENIPAQEQNSISILENQKSKSTRFLEVLSRHKLLGVFVRQNGQQMMRSEHWTVFLWIVMLSIFVTGLFYDNDKEEENTEEEESDKSVWETMSDFSIRDFWIVVYSILITLPAPLVLRWFFRRKEIDPSKSVAKQLRKQKIKRVTGYALVIAIVLWCSWSCIAFSLSFGYNPAQLWLISFSMEKGFDLFIIDPITALIIFSITGYLKANKSKNRRSLTAIGPDDEVEVPVLQLDKQVAMISLPDVSKNSRDKERGKAIKTERNY